MLLNIDCKYTPPQRSQSSYTLSTRFGPRPIHPSPNRPTPGSATCCNPPANRFLFGSSPVKRSSGFSCSVSFAGVRWDTIDCRDVLTDDLCVEMIPQPDRFWSCVSVPWSSANSRLFPTGFRIWKGCQRAQIADPIFCPASLEHPTQESRVPALSRLFLSTESPPYVFQPSTWTWFCESESTQI